MYPDRVSCRSFLRVLPLLMVMVFMAACSPTPTDRARAAVGKPPAESSRPVLLTNEAPTNRAVEVPEVTHTGVDGFADFETAPTPIGAREPFQVTVDKPLHMQAFDHMARQSQLERDRQVAANAALKEDWPYKYESQYRPGQSFEDIARNPLPTDADTTTRPTYDQCQLAFAQAADTDDMELVTGGERLLNLCEQIHSAKH